MTKSKRMLIVIPARGGSKGVPGKNLKRVGGVSLLANSILKSRAVSLPVRVVVSTDDQKIADHAVQYGAEVVMRPENLSTDKSPSEAALIHVLTELYEATRMPDFIAMIQVTSPFISTAEIEACLKQLQNSNADTVFTATPTHKFLWRENATKVADGINHNPNKRLMRQELEPQYMENGAVTAMRVEHLLRLKTRYGGQTQICPTSEFSNFDIDTPADLLIAQAVESRLHFNLQTLFKAHPIPSHIVFDFDGIFTNNTVLTLEDGREGVVSNKRDALGLECLKRAGIEVLVLTGEENASVLHRCNKIGVDMLQAKDKLSALKQWLSKSARSADRCLYVGSDINDLECMAHVLLSACPDSAPDQVRNQADLVIPQNGGEGVVWSLWELIESAKTSLKIAA